MPPRRVVKARSGLRGPVIAQFLANSQTSAVSRDEESRNVRAAVSSSPSNYSEHCHRLFVLEGDVFDRSATSN